MNICFIPARDSSTRMPNKAMAKFKNGNLVTNTIEQALESKIFDRIILSSNSEKILTIADDYGVERHLRDDSQDQIIGVLRQAFLNLNVDDYDTVGLLLVTCPLRHVRDIISGYNLFIENDRNYPVVSVKKNENPVQMSFIEKNGHLKPMMPESFYRSTRKQDHEDTYYFNDAFIFNTVKMFIYNSPTLYGVNALPYVMPWERSIAIDYEFQWKISKCLGEADE